MAKVSKGRVSGSHGMDRHTAEELYAWADALELQASDPTNTDDPKWLKRRADRLRKLADKKQKAAEHKTEMRMSHAAVTSSDPDVENGRSDDGGKDVESR